jgi:hypothetical protein
MEVSFANT